MPIVEEVQSDCGLLSVIREGNMLALWNDGVGQSCIYTDESIFQPVFVGVQRIIDDFYLVNRIEKALILGGGCCTIPRFLIKRFDNSIGIDSVEYNETVIYLCKKYFLNNLPLNKLSLIKKDAFDFIIETALRYDLIFIDLFDGDCLSPKIYEESSFLQNVYLHTATTSIIIINVYRASDEVIDGILSKVSPMFETTLVSREADARYITLIKGDFNKKTIIETFKNYVD